MSVTEARAICPSVQIERRIPEEEAEDLSDLASQLLQVSPSVAPLPPHALVAEIGRTALLLARNGEGPPPQRVGAERVVMERVRRRLRSLGHAVRVVIADDPSTALACAAWGQHDQIVPIGGGPAALAPLPLAALGLPMDAHDLLVGLGIATIGDFARLPPASLTSRFPPLIVLAHQLARGNAPAPILPLETEDEAIVLQQDLPSPVCILEALLFVINALLREACAQLAVSGRAAVHLGLSLGLEGGRWQHLSIRLGDPTRDSNRILALVRARMEQVQLAGPAESVCLEVIDPIPFDGRQRDIIDRQRSVEKLADLSARLQDALGQANVGVPRCVDHQRPESAWACDPIRAEELGDAVVYRSRAAAPLVRSSAHQAVGIARGARPTAPSFPPEPHAPYARTVRDVRHPTVRQALQSDPAAEWEGFLAPLQAARPALLLPQPVAVDARTGVWGRPVSLHIDGRWMGVVQADGPERRRGGWWTTAPFDREYWRVTFTDGRKAWVYREDERWALHGWWDADTP